MSHLCGMSSSDKEKILNVFNNQLKSADKNPRSVNRFTADCNCSNHSKTDEQNKMKRRRSRKDRSQMRGGGKEVLAYKSHHHQCRRQISSDMAAHFENGCHSSCHCPSRRAASFPTTTPAAQEPSIITDSRLIGHQGLFNHEVKSIDIERLLSEQRKLKLKSGQQVHENKNATSHTFSTSQIPSPSSINDLLVADNDESLPLEKQTGHDDCEKKDNQISQGSEITAGQRAQPQLELSLESVQSISLKNSSSDVVIVKSNKMNPDVSAEGKESQLTLTVMNTLNRKVKGHMISALDHTPMNRDSPVHHTQAHGVSPSPLQLSSSPIADISDIQPRRPDPDCVSQSVGAVAARLTDSLRFPLLRRRNLVAESREVLLRALRDNHGSQLQGNLHEVQRCLSFGADPSKKVQPQESTMMEELLPPDVFKAAFQAETANQTCFDAQKTTPFRTTGSRHFSWKSRPQPNRNMEQTADWLTSPVETSVSIFDDITRPSCAPQFCMDFEPSGGTASSHLFSPPSCWGQKASQSEPWEDSFNRNRSNKDFTFHSFENTFKDNTRAERSSTIRPFFPYQTQLPDRRPAELMHFPDPFESDRYSFAPSFPTQTHHPQESFHPYSQFSHPSTGPPLRSNHHTDMKHYPPSHMIDKDPAAPLSSFPSPEQWTFPPMRLY
ncbi:uncharacterized protein si:dkey-250k15.4 isoform X1 [Gymnodraco acuticeps]|uniref:Uncharacterized protein si:dkey-250k15.4 isoform X1 n=1 Tax=Gymnodraco acuticeps TaxID=8218 RepID=A0A6P8UKI7_GYMAC|nr:uncharacterized protein si:dkey-250k15.4 isoform X1 [Gymnodraco acuticeps]